MGPADSATNDRFADDSGRRHAREDFKGAWFETGRGALVRRRRQRAKEGPVDADFT
jgi:hypothetical protein